MSDEEPQMADWNGGIGSAQLGWLNEQLALAKLSGERVIVACHHQIGQGATACLYLFILHSDAYRNLDCRQQIQAVFRTAVQQAGHVSKLGLCPIVPSIPGRDTVNSRLKMRLCNELLALMQFCFDATPRPCTTVH